MLIPPLDIPGVDYFFANPNTGRCYALITPRRAGTCYTRMCSDIENRHWLSKYTLNNSEVLKFVENLQNRQEDGFFKNTRAVVFHNHFPKIGEETVILKRPCHNTDFDSLNMGNDSFDSVVMPLDRLYIGRMRRYLQSYKNA